MLDIHCAYNINAITGCLSKTNYVDTITDIEAFPLT